VINTTCVVPTGAILFNPMDSQHFRAGLRYVASDRGFRDEKFGLEVWRKEFESAVSNCWIQSWVTGRESRATIHLALRAEISREVSVACC
jgi:hypothetical protein